MARRRGGSSFGSSRRSAPAPTRQPAVAPQNQVQAQPNIVQKAPGFLSNVASTAVGVGVGHTIAHGLTSALYGNSSKEVQNEQQPQQYNQQQQQSAPCQLEMESFFNCTQQQYDLSMCEGLNQVLKECRMRYSNPSM